MSVAVAVGILMCNGCLTTFGNRPNVGVSEILEMTKAGTPADEIIQKMEASRMVYRLRASQLVDLAKQGVAGSVLDYMQQTYLDAVAREAAYEEWRLSIMFRDDRYDRGPWGWPHERVHFRDHDRESPHHEQEESKEHPKP